MIPSQFLFDAAKKLGVEKEFISDQVESKEYPEFTCKLTGIVISDQSGDGYPEERGELSSRFRRMSAYRWQVLNSYDHFL